MLERGRAQISPLCTASRTTAGSTSSARCTAKWSKAATSGTSWRTVPTSLIFTATPPTSTSSARRSPCAGKRLGSHRFRGGRARIHTTLSTLRLGECAKRTQHKLPGCAQRRQQQRDRHYLPSVWTSRQWQQHLERTVGRYLRQ